MVLILNVMSTFTLARFIQSWVSKFHVLPIWILVAVGWYALNEVNTDDCLVLATSKSNYMYLNVYTQTKILAC